MDSIDFSLDQFEGPLDLLLYLVQKEELDLLDVPITELTQQLGKKTFSIDLCADTMALTATLLLLKSRKLLPKDEVPLTPVDEDRLELLNQLIAYCRVKEATKELVAKEKQQHAFFLRSPVLTEQTRGPGLEDVSLDQLALQLRSLLSRHAAKQQCIQDEAWHVAPKMLWLKEQLGMHSYLKFKDVFDQMSCRQELIVTFLALLELIKTAHIRIQHNEGDFFIYAV